jgi:hypothetical protein
MMLTRQNRRKKKKTIGILCAARPTGIALELKPSLSCEKLPELWYIPDPSWKTIVYTHCYIKWSVLVTSDIQYFLFTHTESEPIEIVCYFVGNHCGMTFFFNIVCVLLVWQSDKGLSHVNWNCNVRVSHKRFYMPLTQTLTV